MKIYRESGLFGVAMRFLNSVYRTRSILFLIITLPILAPPIHGIKRSAETFPNMDSALFSIRQTFNVSTGLELAIGDMDRGALRIDLYGNNVARVFDSLVKQRPGYRWRLEDGVYDVYPKAKAHTFSQVKVADYVVRDVTLREAVDEIEKLPEVKQWLATNRMRRQNLITATGLGVPPPLQRRSLALQDVTVRTILNRIYRSFDKTEWTIWNQGQDIGMSFSF
jgi:hypothetical protein